MSGTIGTPRALLSLLIATSLVVAGAAQARDTGIKPEDIKRQPLASALVEMAYSPSQQSLFVSAPDWKEEAKSRVLRLDPTTLAVQAEIPLQVKGFGVALDDAGHRLYLTQGFNGSVGVVDTTTNRSVGSIVVTEKSMLEKTYKDAGITGKRLEFLLGELKRFKITEDYQYRIREMKYDAQTGRLFLPGLGFGVDSVLFVVDTRNKKLEKMIPGFGYNAVGITLDEKGRRVFVSNMQGQLITLNADTLAITSTKEIQADQLLNLVYDGKNNRLLGVDQGIDRDNYRNTHLGHDYVKRSSGHRVFALDADSGKVLASELTDEVPIGLLLDENNQRVYVTNRKGVRVEHGVGTLTVFDSKTLKRLQTVELPPHPNSLALDTSNNVLFVTVKNDGASTKAGKPESVVRIQLPKN
ncbi:YncE family protein [Serratia grimesii]|uniref:YncE family protein n=1 Tax=Serratia grimesii TaxID=82995 RepID=UPI0039AEFF0C